MKIGSCVWYANKVCDPNAEITTYSLPVKITLRNNYFTCQPASVGGYLSIVEYGEDLQKTWICKANALVFNGKIKEGDLMWVDGDKPIGDDYENSANARVINVSTVDRSITITLEKNQVEQ
jgi:hypothetical protein